MEQIRPKTRGDVELTPAIGIFVKTPGLSPIKTRLGRSLGRPIAEEWHRRAALCVAISAGATGLPVYWAVAEAEGMRHPLWQGLPRLAQGEGGLGARMARVHSEIVQRHGAGILVGADLPQIGTRHLDAAAAWLDSSDRRYVLGPARDGGFWLFGANRELPAATWKSVKYSRDDTAQRLIDAIAAPCWELLQPMTDLDRASDLQAVLAELDSVVRPSSEQQALARWLEIQIEQAA